MDIIRFLNHHPAITSCHEVSEICKPLELLGINYFSFVRIYDDHKRISFCTHEKWQYLFYERFMNEEYKSQYVTFEKMAKDNDITVLSTYPDNEAYIDGATHFDIFDGIVLRERLKNFAEIAYFGTLGEGTKVVNFCLSHIELLKRFVAYFKETTAAAIKIQEANKIIPPTIYIAKEKQIETPDHALSKHPAVQQFLNSIKTKRYHLANSDEDAYLTGKEYECLNWVAMGKSAEEIGLILDISKRTVEEHLEKIKTKMQCHKLTKLIYDAMNQGLIMRSRYS